MAKPDLNELSDALLQTLELGSHMTIERANEMGYYTIEQIHAKLVEKGVNVTIAICRSRVRVAMVKEVYETVKISCIGYPLAYRLKGLHPHERR